MGRQGRWRQPAAGVTRQRPLGAKRNAPSLASPQGVAATCRIGAIHPAQNTLLSPTEIAEELSQRAGHRIQAQMVNKLLVDLGLATRVGKDKRIALTEKGKSMGGVATLASSEGNGWQGAWVKWPLEVVDLLTQYLPTRSRQRPLSASLERVQS